MLLYESNILSIPYDANFKLKRIKMIMLSIISMLKLFRAY